MVYSTLAMILLINQEDILTISEPIIPSSIITTREFLCDGQAVLISHTTGSKSDGYPKITRLKIANATVSKRDIDTINNFIDGRTIDGVDIVQCKRCKEIYSTFYSVNLSDFDGKQVIRAFVSFEFRSSILQSIQERKGVVP